MDSEFNRTMNGQTPPPTNIVYTEQSPPMSLNEIPEGKKVTSASGKAAEPSSQRLG